VNNHTARGDAGFLPDFATDGLLDGFGGLDKAGEGRVPVRRPAFLAAEQDAVGVVTDDGHDDGGVGARE